MWKFKSPKTGKAVDVYEFYKDDSLSTYPLHEARKAYEKMTYMIQRDEVLMYLADYFPLEYPKKLYTFSNEEIKIRKENKDTFPIDDFLENRADKIINTELEVNKYTGDLIKTKNYKSWHYFEPEMSIKGCYETGKKHLESLKHLDKIEKGYLEIIELKYLSQHTLAKEIFLIFDETDKKGFILIYNSLFSLFNRDIIYSKNNLKDNDYYKDFLKIYPDFDLDIELLLNDGTINNGKPYISIIQDGSFKWNYPIGSLADYISFLAFYTYLKSIDSKQKKSCNWKAVKYLFHDYEENKLKDAVCRGNKESYELLAKCKIVKKLNELKKYPDRFKDEIGHIIELNTKIRNKHNEIDALISVK